MRHNQLKASGPNSTAGRDKGRGPCKSHGGQRKSIGERERPSNKIDGGGNRGDRREAERACEREGPGIPRVYGTKLTK